MQPRRHPSDKLIKQLEVVPPIDPQKSSPTKRQRLSRSQIRILRRGLDAEAFKTFIKKGKTSTSKLRTAIEESRAQESLGGKSHRKTAKSRRAKKSRGWF